MDLRNAKTYTIAIPAVGEVAADASAKSTKRPLIDACLYSLLGVDRHTFDWGDTNAYA